MPDNSNEAWNDFDPKSKPDAKAVEQAFQDADAAEGGLSERRKMQMGALRSYSEREWRAARERGISRRGSSEENELDSAVTAYRSAARGAVPHTTNVTRNLVNSGAALVCRARPVPFFLADGSSYQKAKEARQKERWVVGLMRKEQAHKRSRRMVKNGCITGDGYMGIERDYKAKRLCLKPWFTLDVVPDLENGYFYYWDRMPVRKLALIYGKEALANLEQDEDGEAIIPVLNAWKLESFPGAGDGRYLKCVKTAVLESRAYPHEAPPCVHWMWCPDPTGAFGVGIPWEVKGLQTLINIIDTSVHSGIWQGGQLRIFAHRQAKLNQSHVSNSLRAQLLEWSGTYPPNFVITPAVAADLVAFRQTLVSACYEMSGLSQSNATSTPSSAGLSGRAMQLEDKSENQRFIEAIRDYDEVIGIDLPRRLLEGAADMQTECGDMTVLYKGQRTATPIKLSEITTGLDDIEIEIFSTSGLASSVGARIAQVDFMVQRGYWTKEQTLPLFDGMPNVQREEDLDLLAVEAVEFLLEKVLAGGTVDEYGPSPDLPFERSLRRVVQEILRATTKTDIDEAAVDRLRDWKLQLLLMHGFLAEAADLGFEAVLAGQGLDPSKQPPAPPPPAGAPGAPAIPGALDAVDPLAALAAAPAGAPAGAPPLGP